MSVTGEASLHSSTSSSTEHTSQHNTPVAVGGWALDASA